VTQPAGAAEGVAGQTLDERYGRRAGSRTLGMRVAVGAVVAVLLGYLMWTAWFHSQPTLSGKLRTYDVISPHEVRVTLDVFRPDGVAATCTLRAQASDHSVVGEDEVLVAAGEPGTSSLTTVLRTDREATSISVVDCS